MRWEPASDPAPAPRLGEHTAEILWEAGFSAGEIAALIHGGAAGTAAEP